METPDRPPADSLIARSVENVVTVLGIWHPALRHRIIHAGISDALVPVLIIVLIHYLGFRLSAPDAAVSVAIFEGYAGRTGLSIVALCLGLILARRGSDFAELFVGVLWALAFGAALASFAVAALELHGVWNWILRDLVATHVLAILFLGFRLGWLPSGLVTMVFVTPAVLTVLNLISSGAGPNGALARVPPDTEMIYAAQPGLLADQFDRLRRGNPDAVELFAVLGAGYPHEGVFQREVEAISILLAERFGAANRVIKLVNSGKAHVAYPLLNRGNLRASLKAVSGAMDHDDLLFLYLTSHGATSIFSTQFQGVIGRDFGPSDIAMALEEAEVQNAIIVISACFSGSFIDALAGAGRLILTASDADSSSFGCNDQNEWTEWGRAFFAEALKRTRDPRAAAEMAREMVALREVEQDMPPSSPQISEGAEIGAVLDLWLAGFDQAAAQN